MRTNHSFERSERRRREKRPGPWLSRMREKRREAKEEEGEEEEKKRESGRRKMKKSPMPCERRDLSSMTPDEPAKDGEAKGGMPPHSSGYVHSSPKKARYTTGTPIVR